MPLWKSATTTGATLKECHNENPPVWNTTFHYKKEDVVDTDIYMNEEGNDNYWSTDQVYKGTKRTNKWQSLFF